jgi:hypothetical protein
MTGHWHNNHWREKNFYSKTISLDCIVTVIPVYLSINTSLVFEPRIFLNDLKVFEY